MQERCEVLEGRVQSPKRHSPGIAKGTKQAQQEKGGAQGQLQVVAQGCLCGARIQGSSGS